MTMLRAFALVTFISVLSCNFAAAEDADANVDDAYANANDDYNDDDIESVCKVYDKNDLFTVAVQIILALFAVASLYLKRMQEKPKRTLQTWFLDVGKQAAGACYAHVLNMMIASIISRNIRGDSILEDQCAWYGLSYLIDTTLGLVLAVIGLRILDHFANERDWTHLKHSGVYSGPTAYYHWASQVVAWLLILTVTKWMIYVFMWVCSGPLAWIGNALFAPFQGYKHVELLFVMIFFPGVLNVIYFWIADSYLKADSNHAEAHEHDENGLQDKKESLMTDVAEAELKIYQPATPAWSLLAGGRKEAQQSTVV